MHDTRPPLLEMRRIGKRFGAATVLAEVSFECRAGEVHALCGENGAGKSTLMKVLNGIYTPDSGEILIDGRPVAFRHPSEARAAGVAIIHQELSLLPYRSLAQNLFLGREPRRRGFIDRRAMQAAAVAALARVGSALDPDIECGRLSVGEQQVVEIAKALSLDARILVLDEPTAALDDVESTKLFGLIRELRAAGVALVYISHRMAEVEALADQVTVLKDGRVMASLPAAKADPDTIVRLMVGRELGDFYPPPAARPPGDEVLRLQAAGNDELHGIDLRLHQGEIVGVAGLESSGKVALARAICGERPFTRGEVTAWDGQGRARSPRQAAQRGIGFVPDDRKREGLGLRQSLRDNAALTLRALASPLAPASSGARCNGSVDAVLQRVDARAASFDLPVEALSGGNQQKVVLARWLLRAPRLWVVCEPTRGIDVGAKTTVYRLLRDFADSGGSVLLVSSDMAEVIGVSDRICVMASGRIVAQLPRGAAEETVMAHAVQHRGDGEAERLGQRRVEFPPQPSEPATA